MVAALDERFVLATLLRSGGALSTVTLTALVGAVLPAASRATAVTECAPFAAVEVIQARAYGAAVTSAPRLAPSSLNCTPTTPTLSEALAETATTPETMAPEVGAVIDTVWGVVSPGGGGRGAPHVPLVAQAVAALRATMSAPRSRP